MKVVAVCSSTIQLLNVINLKCSFFSSDEMDLILTDDFRNYEVLKNNAMSSGIFNNVFSIVWIGKYRELATKNKIAKYKQWLFAPRNILKQLPRNLYYDVFLFNTNSVDVDIIFTKCKQINPNLKVNFIEDGYSTYCVQGRGFLTRKYAQKWKKFILRILKRSYAIDAVSEMLLTTPENMEWDPGIKIVKVPQIQCQNSEIVDAANTVFGYEKCNDTYDKKIIFFEESYRAQGIEIDDVKVVNMIAEWFGKENIMVKIHPRNKVNVFKDLGYKTNEDTHIPWEVIYLNQPALRNCILISIASGSIATPYTMMGEKTNSIALVNISELVPEGFSSIYFDYLYRKVFSQRMDIFSCPTSYKELRECIEKCFH